MLIVMAEPLVYVVDEDISVHNEAPRTSSTPPETDMENVTVSVTLFSLDHSQDDPPGRPEPMLCFMLPCLAVGSLSRKSLRRRIILRVVANPDAEAIPKVLGCAFCTAGEIGGLNTIDPVLDLVSSHDVRGVRPDDVDFAVAAITEVELY